MKWFQSLSRLAADERTSPGGALRAVSYSGVVSVCMPVEMRTLHKIQGNAAVTIDMKISYWCDQPKCSSFQATGLPSDPRARSCLQRAFGFLFHEVSLSLILWTKWSDDRRKVDTACQAIFALKLAAHPAMSIHLALSLRTSTTQPRQP